MTNIMIEYGIKCNVKDEKMKKELEMNNNSLF